jgi:Ser-tRNA(Ala) deacylase AlaX
LESLPKEAKIGGVVFLAGWVNLTDNANEVEEDKEIARPWIKTSIGWDKIKSHTRKFIGIFSDDDPLVPITDSKIFKNQLGAKIIVEHGKQHFSGSSGIKELPSALNAVLEIAGLKYTANMQPTKLTYLENSDLLLADATVLEMSVENGRNIVVLDQTIFYPQGGGQPYDKGAVEGEDSKFIVEEVRFADGIVKHIGKFEGRSFKSGEIVKCAVDAEHRLLNSRLHTAGHVVDMAVTELKLNWVSSKGYHFMDGPYVEYTGSFDAADKDKLKSEIEIFCNKFIVEDRKTEVRFMDKENLGEVCKFVPDYIPEGKPARVVMYGNFGVPCGGTHISHLGVVRHITIREIKMKSGNIRVSYEIER